MAPAPELFHQRWSRGLFKAIEKHVHKNKLGEVFFAPVDVVLSEQNVVQPDLVFVAAANAGILRKQAIVGAPDLVVEIISASSVQRDRYEKKELYARSGVKEFWLADMANRSIEVLTLSGRDYRLLCCASEKGKIQSRVLPGFELEIGGLF